MCPRISTQKSEPMNRNGRSPESCFWFFEKYYARTSGFNKFSVNQTSRLSYCVEGWQCQSLPNVFTHDPNFTRRNRIVCCAENVALHGERVTKNVRDEFFAALSTNWALTKNDGRACWNFSCDLVPIYNNNNNRNISRR